MARSFFPASGLASDGTYINVHWEPEDLYTIEINAVADRLDEIPIFMEGARALAIEAMARRFSTGTDPDGKKWDDLSPDSRGGPGESHLTRTGEMSAELSSAASFEVRGDTLYFTGAGDRKGIWPYHEFGADRRGQSLSPQEGETQQMFQAYIEERNPATLIHHESGTFSKNVLPARPFVGLDDAGWVQTGALWDNFVNGAVAMMWQGGTGRAQTRIAATGQFGGVPGFGRGYGF